MEYVSFAANFEVDDRIAIVNKTHEDVAYYRVGEDTSRSDVQDQIGTGGTVMAIVRVEE